MLTLCQAWEFEYSSDCSINVINTPRGIEVFALDVLPIIFPELNGQYHQIPINATKRIVVKANKFLDITTLDAVALHALADYPHVGAKTKVVRKLMQWVRTNVKPSFAKNTEEISLVNQSQYVSFKIDYHQKESLINYLALKGDYWADKYINLYLQLITKKIPLSTTCPIATDEYSQLLRAEYFQISQLISNQPLPDSYEDLYLRLVLIPANLLMAQQLDFLVFHLAKFQQSQFQNILEQGLFLQALYSISQKLSSYRELEELTPLYLRLIKHFSNEVEEDEETKNA